jgi:ketopantoate reductase
MKIAVMGAGAVGYYGGLLARAENDEVRLIGRARAICWKRIRTANRPRCRP